jgi:2-keto-4-pentenoate hydratase
MTEDWIENLILARRTDTRFAPTEKSPQTVAQAYEIQVGVAGQIGAVGAFKTARKPGEAMIYAPIFAADLVQSGAEVPVLDTMGIELEVGLYIHTDLPPDHAGISANALAAFVTPDVVIELVDTRVTGPLAQDAIVKLADNQINAGLVVGDHASGWASADFGAVQAKFTAGPEVILDGAASVPGGSALETFAALAQHLGQHCGGLRQGQIIITGSLHPLVYVAKGTEVQGQIAGIGTVRVKLI